MKEFTIDFTEVRTIWYFYKAIIEGMEFPDWCGMTMDAVWDLLTDEEPPATIYIKGIDKLPKDLLKKKDMLIETIEEAIEWFAKFDEELKLVIIK